MDELTRMIVNAWPILEPRLPVGVVRYQEASLTGVTTHWIPPDLVWSEDLCSVPHGLVMAVIQAGGGKETLFVLMRDGERTFHFRCVGLDPWAPGIDESSDRLAEALRRWDAGEPVGRVSEDDDDFDFGD